MTTFRTEIRIPKSPDGIDHHQSILSIGSCFAEHLHTRLRSAHFKSYCNPCGIVYNPISISQQLMRILENKPWGIDDLIYDKGLYHGLFHHGSFSNIDLSQTLDQMNIEFKEASIRLKSTDFILITLGSAIVYHLIEKDIIVANCHKISAQRFNRKMLSVDEIVQATNECVNTLLLLKPAIQIIFTISPIRYLREGFVDNTRSKARLILAIEELCSNLPQVHYFPAYEILLDDLRDYRFYKEDMVHPNDQAINYIWEIFTNTFMNKETLQLMKELRTIRLGLLHRPLHPDREVHQKFKHDLEVKMFKLKNQYPFIQFD